MGDFYRDWTLVKRRGRRRLDRPLFQDCGREWKASTPTVSYGGWNKFRSPNPTLQITINS